jgi:hypothetical protein
MVSGTRFSSVFTPSTSRTPLGDRPGQGLHVAVRAVVKDEYLGRHFPLSSTVLCRVPKRPRKFGSSVRRLNGAGGGVEPPVTSTNHGLIPPDGVLPGRSISELGESRRQPGLGRQINNVLRSLGIDLS